MWQIWPMRVSMAPDFTRCQHYHSVSGENGGVKCQWLQILLDANTPRGRRSVNYRRSVNGSRFY